MGYYGRAHGEADGSDLKESAAHTEQEKTFPAGEDSGLDMQLMVGAAAHEEPSIPEGLHSMVWTHIGEIIEKPHAGAGKELG